MIAERLKSLADGAVTLDVDARARLAEVHARIEAARRRRRAGIACGLVIAFVVGAGIVGRSLMVDRAGGPADSPASPSPVEQRDPSMVGYLGLPPAGAVPTDPHVPALVLRYFAESQRQALRLWLFDDGRLVTDRQYFDGNHLTAATGYVERHLTPRGVEALRAYVARTAGPGEACCPLSAVLEVRKRESLVSLGPKTVDYIRLAEPESWLPRGSWADGTPLPYVAATWAVCYGYGTRGDSSRFPRDVLLDPLPQPVVEVLLANLRVENWQGLEPGLDCSVVTIDQAHAVAAALGQVVLTDSSPLELLSVQVVLDEHRTAGLAPGAGGPEGYFGIFPVMPDGTWVCTLCA